jgi:hypothetical protein
MLMYEFIISDGVEHIAGGGQKKLESLAVRFCYPEANFLKRLILQHFILLMGSKSGGLSSGG